MIKTEDMFVVTWDTDQLPLVDVIIVRDKMKCLSANLEVLKQYDEFVWGNLSELDVEHIVCSTGSPNLFTIYKSDGGFFVVEVVDHHEVDNINQGKETDKPIYLFMGKSELDEVYYFRLV